MLFSRQKYLDRLIAHKHNHQIKVVTGIRRCGKSFLLFNLFYNHLIQSGVDSSHIIRIDLEDRRQKELRNPDALLEYIDSRHLPCPLKKNGYRRNDHWSMCPIRSKRS